MRILAIGDIHGCSAHLDALLAAIALTPADTLIFLGDYIDRGPDSKGVIERILALRAQRPVICLQGNHEQFMLRSRTSSELHSTWLMVGGAQTLGSYGTTPGRIGTLADVPESHWHFFEQECLPYYETPKHLFAHANLDPALPLEEQSERILLWTSLSEPVAHVSGKTLICGHTAQKTGLILNLGTTICIDTYAYGGGKLTCLDVLTGDYWQADMLSRITCGTLTPLTEKNPL